MRGQSASSRRSPAIFAVLLLLATPLSGQARDSSARMERVADGVYAIIHDDATTDWPDGTTDWPNGNTGVIVGDEGVLVVDSDYLPSRAKADIALIRRVTDKPVRYLVNTHWHGDHTHGNATYRDAFPGLVIVGQRANRHFIEFNQARFPALVGAADGLRRQQLARFERILAAGKDSTGRPLSADEKRKLAITVRQHRAEIEELTALRVAPPTLLFDDDLTLLLGRRRVELHNWGRANSPDDVSIYLPDQRVLFTGDIVVAPMPYTAASYPTHWIDVLKGIEAMPVATLVPGHGPVMHDFAYVRKVRGLLEAATSRTEAAVRRGTLKAQIVDSVSLEDLRPSFVSGRDVNEPGLWDQFKVTLVQRSYLCVVGYEC